MDFFLLIMNYLPVIHAHWEALQPIADDTLRYLHDLPTDGLIHGDIDASNALIMPNEQIALLDFDFFGPGWRGYDLGTLSKHHPNPCCQLAVCLTPSLLQGRNLLL